MTVATAPTTSEAIAANMPRVLAAMDAIQQLYVAELASRTADSVPSIEEERAQQLGLLLSLASELNSPRLSHLVGAAQSLWEGMYGEVSSHQFPAPVAAPGPPRQ